MTLRIWDSFILSFNGRDNGLEVTILGTTGSGVFRATE